MNIQCCIVASRSWQKDGQLRQAAMITRACSCRHIDFSGCGVHYCEALENCTSHDTDKQCHANADRRPVMRMSTTLILAGTLIASIWLLAGTSQPADAAGSYPWCARYGGYDSGGVPNCGFTSHAQCMAAISGTQGFCEQNWPQPAASPGPFRGPPRRF
jgi:hypothetical protein